MEKHFESFLRDCMDQGHIQVNLVLRFHEPTGKVAFYAIGQRGAASSEVFEAVVEGKHVRRIAAVSREAIAVEDLSDEELDDMVLSELHPSPEDEAAAAK